MFGVRLRIFKVIPDNFSKNNEFFYNMLSDIYHLFSHAAVDDKILAGDKTALF
jgi:hypothetical protein